MTNYILQMEESCRPSTPSQRESTGIVIKSHSRTWPGFNLGSPIRHVMNPAQLSDSSSYQVPAWRARPPPGSLSCGELKQDSAVWKRWFGSAPSKSAFSVLTSWPLTGSEPNTQHAEPWILKIVCSTWILKTITQLLCLGSGGEVNIFQCKLPFLLTKMGKYNKHLPPGGSWYKCSVEI